VARVPRFLPALTVLVVISILLTWFLWGRPWFMSKTFAVQRLEALLPELEKMGLEAYRNQSWCKNIVYSYGQFSETSHPTTCNLFDGTAQPFDKKAKRDFQILNRTFLFSGMRIRFVNLYYKNDNVRLAEFDLACFLCSRTHYVYEPNYVLQQDMGSEMWFDAINETWYEVNEDWN
jgi:hypothetical protein